MKFHLIFKVSLLSVALITGGSLFAQNATKDISENQSKPIRLSIRVLAGPNTDALTYTGRWVYVKGGQEISVEISDKTNRFNTCIGDYIKSCEIRRTSTNEARGFASWFYFYVNEGGTNVFESPELTNEDLFRYRRKQG